jgi:hypothetical protein
VKLLRWIADVLTVVGLVALVLGAVTTTAWLAVIGGSAVLLALAAALGRRAATRHR